MVIPLFKEYQLPPIIGLAISQDVYICILCQDLEIGMVRPIPLVHYRLDLYLLCAQRKDRRFLICLVPGITLDL